MKKIRKRGSEKRDCGKWVDCRWATVLDEWEKDEVRRGGKMTERDAARDEPQQELHVMCGVRMRGSRGIKLLLLKEPFDL